MENNSRAFIQAMLKHLPPSGATLQLLDVDGLAGAALAENRGDLDIAVINRQAVDWQITSGSIDSVVAFDCSLDSDFLNQTLTMLRPGGRFIFVDPAGEPGQKWVSLLEQAGFVRILVEPALEAVGVLARGEKPHTAQSTIDRIKQIADRDDVTDLASIKGRYVHLLIRQTPNKPVWALKAGERVEWQAVALTGEKHISLLAFSSLPKAVAFMQPAVMQGVIKDINKVAKFSRETARNWSLPLLFNPTLETLAGREITLLPVDPETAEVPDE